MMETEDSFPLLELPPEVIWDVLLSGSLERFDLISTAKTCRLLEQIVRDLKFYHGLFVPIPNHISMVPSPRLCCSLTVGESASYKNKLFVYGGHINKKSEHFIHEVRGDLFEFSLTDRTWRKLPFDKPKTEHSTVFFDDALWILGGHSGLEYTNNLVRFDITTGKAIDIHTDAPFSPRSTQTAVVWQRRMYIFGGWCGGEIPIWYNDIYCYDFDSNTWSAIITLGDMPGPRCSHGAFVHLNYMYIFGGYSGKFYYNGFWRFDFISERWERLNQYGDIPQPRSRFAGAIIGDYLYILGGWNKVEYFNDFFCFHIPTLTWTKIENHFIPIPQMSQHRIVSVGDYLYSFGGIDREISPTNNLYITRIQ